MCALFKSIIASTSKYLKRNCFPTIAITAQVHSHTKVRQPSFHLLKLIMFLRVLALHSTVGTVGHHGCISVLTGLSLPIVT